MKFINSIVLVLVIIICSFMITGCNNRNQDIIGTWKHDKYVYTFKDDKTGIYDANGTIMKFTYKDNGKKVTILYDNNTIASSYEYKINDNKLIIKDSFGSNVEYIKK